MLARMFIMASISIGLSSQARAVLDDWQSRPADVVAAIDAAMTQVLHETETHIKQSKLSGQDVGLRSGTLRQDITNQKTGAFSGVVGTTGRTAPYARAILGPDTTTIRPRNAKHLWVPIADNLTTSGVARLSPKALFAKFSKKRISIFKSNAGNTVVFVREGGSYKSGKNKGRLRGKLMFVLKDQVVIHGTDALAEGVNEMRPRMEAILNQHIEAVDN